MRPHHLDSATAPRPPQFQLCNVKVLFKPDARVLDQGNGHMAYADESYITGSRYRSVAVVTLESGSAAETGLLLRELLDDSGLEEFKWEKLRQARERFAALKMLDLTVGFAVQGRLRADVLVWDTQDERHSVMGRDDVANLQRMYYHLFRNVLQRRWPSGSTWHLYPDENSALDWMTIHDCLDASGLGLSAEGDLFEEGEFRLRLARDFHILQIHESCSAKTPLCQLADLFAGLGAYSRSSYTKYERWLRSQSEQLSLGLEIVGVDRPIKLSNRDRERCLVIRHLDEQCKRRRLGVGLRSSQGFRTYDPSNPINFWLYQPQRPEDIAPVRGWKRQ